MNRIRAVIAASSMTLALGPCSPAELREWSQTTGIEVDATAQQHIADCHAASVEADALAPEHDYLDLDTAMRVYELIARGCRRWSEQDIANWAPGVRAVMNRESAGCYNLRRGATFAAHDGAGCAIARQGRFSDSGYGQVLMSVHKVWLCPQEGLCSPDDVIATPTSSMTAFLALIERAGRQGWCFTAKLRRGAICQSMANIPIPTRGT